VSIKEDKIGLFALYRTRRIRPLLKSFEHLDGKMDGAFSKRPLICTTGKSTFQVGDNIPSYEVKQKSEYQLPNVMRVALYGKDGTTEIWFEDVSELSEECCISAMEMKGIMDAMLEAAIELQNIPAVSHSEATSSALDSLVLAVMDLTILPQEKIEWLRKLRSHESASPDVPAIFER
jgi:hypothetical protein